MVDKVSLRHKKNAIVNIEKDECINVRNPPFSFSLSWNSLVESLFSHGVYTVHKLFIISLLINRNNMFEYRLNGRDAYERETRNSTPSTTTKGTIRDTVGPVPRS